MNLLRRACTETTNKVSHAVMIKSLPPKTKPNTAAHFKKSFPFMSIQKSSISGGSLRKRPTLSLSLSRRCPRANSSPGSCGRRRPSPAVGAAAAAPVTRSVAFRAGPASAASGRPSTERKINWIYIAVGRSRRRPVRQPGDAVSMRPPPTCSKGSLIHSSNSSR